MNYILLVIPSFILFLVGIIFVDHRFIFLGYCMTLFFLVIYLCSNKFHSKNLKSYNRLIIIVLLSSILRAALFLFSQTSYFDWDNGSNQGVMFTDGDTSHYYHLFQSFQSINSFESYISENVYYLPFGFNGIILTNVSFIISKLFNFSSFNSTIELMVLIQLFLYNFIRIYFCYKVCSKIFLNRFKYFASIFVAFDPNIIRWDFIYMKESLQCTLITITLALFFLSWVSKKKSSRMVYLFIALLFNYLIFLDRFYSGLFVFTLIGGGAAFNYLRTNKLRMNLKIFLTFVSCVILFLFISYDYLLALRSNSLISLNSFVTFGSPIGFIQILITPLPFRNIVRFDLEYLRTFSFILYYPLLIIFIRSVFLIFWHSKKYIGLVFPLILFVLILGLLVPGGARRRDTFLPVIYICSVFGFVKSSKNSFYRCVA